MKITSDGLKSSLSLRTPKHSATDSASIKDVLSFNCKESVKKKKTPKTKYKKQKTEVCFVLCFGSFNLKFTYNNDTHLKLNTLDK